MGQSKGIVSRMVPKAPQMMRRCSYHAPPGSTLFVYPSCWL